MVTQITAWRTSDGQVFDDQVAAVAHEVACAAKCRLEDLTAMLEDSGNRVDVDWHDLSVEELAKGMLLSAKSFAEFFNSVTGEGKA